jgi:hypothetical protein
MGEQQQARPIEVPVALNQLIPLNVEYRVLLCVGIGCRKAISPASIVEHLRKTYNTKPEGRKQVQEYIQGCSYLRTIIPQLRCRWTDWPNSPTFAVVNGFQCRDCLIKTGSRDAMRQHGKKTDNKKRVANEEIFRWWMRASGCARKPGP